MTGLRWIGVGAVLLGAGPVRAECLGSCANDLLAAFVSMLVYGLIGIVLLVMLVRKTWRRAGLWGLGIVALLALGVPLVSQGWLAWKLRGVEAREVVGVPPSLASRTPLLITPDDYCNDDACSAVLQGLAPASVHVVLTGALAEMDLSRPIPLADLPLELWSAPGEAAEVTRRALSEEERQDAAGRIDYLVVTTWPYYPGDPGPIEAALRANPLVAGMGSGEAIRLLLAPLDRGQAALSLASLQPDLLDLTLRDRALALPLAPRNTQRAANRPAGVEAAARAICPSKEAGEDKASCRWLVER